MTAVQTKSILIVEDEKLLRDVYELLLRSQGYSVFTAVNGQEGMRQLQTHHPNLVLLDLFMPVMDGKEFMRRIHLQDYPGTKVIIYSNLSDSQTETELLALGASEFILKSSMTPQDLVALAARLTA